QAVNLSKFNLSDTVARNQVGIQIEKNGLDNEAIKLYEANHEENFEGNHLYDRLAIMYSRKKLYDEEKRDIKKDIKIIEEHVPKNRADRKTKLEKFQNRLEKLNQIIEKQQ